MEKKPFFERKAVIAFNIILLAVNVFMMVYNDQTINRVNSMIDKVQAERVGFTIDKGYRDRCDSLERSMTNEAKSPLVAGIRLVRPNDTIFLRGQLQYTYLLADQGFNVKGLKSSDGCKVTPLKAGQSQVVYPASLQLFKVNMESLSSKGVFGRLDLENKSGKLQSLIIKIVPGTRGSKETFWPSISYLLDKSFY